MESAMELKTISPESMAKYIDSLSTLDPNTQRMQARESVVKTYEALYRKFPPIHVAETDPAKIWLWSDMHFNHDRIREYTNRPWDCVDQMDADLLKSLTTVPDGHTLIWLGDIGWGQKWTETYAPKTSNVTHILVPGNHDMERGSKRLSRHLPHHFDSIAVGLEGTHDGKSYILTHYPWYDRRFADVHIHGHTHNSIPQQYGHINVSVEMIGYKPTRLIDWI